MKINNFRGDLTDVSVKKEALVLVCMFIGHVVLKSLAMNSHAMNVTSQRTFFGYIDHKRTSYRYISRYKGPFRRTTTGHYTRSTHYSEGSPDRTRQCHEYPKPFVMRRFLIEKYTCARQLNGVHRPYTIYRNIRAHTRQCCHHVQTNQSPTPMPPNQCCRFIRNIA